MNTIEFSYSVSANKGNVRSNNEDNFYFNGKFLTAQDRDIPASFSSDSDKDLLLFGVFDGMGGEALGEEASLCCAKSMKECHKKLKTLSEIRIQGTVLSTLKDANKKICQKILESGERRIGTTFTALCIDDDRAKVFNVGDSRVYMLRKGKLSQLSTDDTSVQRMINMGFITAEEAETHADRHKLTQHLGIFEDELTIEPHVVTDIDICKGDKFLLCSDGLTDMVTDEKIEEIMKSGGAAEDISKKLVEEALANGGIDNVTAMVVSANSNSQIRKPRKSKKNIYIVATVAIIAIIVAAIFIFSGSDEPINENKEEFSVSISIDDTELNVGEKSKLSYFTSFRDTQKRDVFHFESSDSNVIEILDDKTGEFVAKSTGTAIITVKYSTASDTIELTVVE